MKVNFRIIIVVIICFIVAFLSFTIAKDSKTRQYIAVENAEIKNVKYGLLSIHSWKRQVSEIISKKINEFELDGKNRKVIQKQIEKALYNLIDDVEIILEEKNQEGNFFKRSINSMIVNPIASNYLRSLRKKVPKLTVGIINTLNKKKTRENLKKLIQQKIDSYLDETVGKEDLSKIEFIISENNCENKKDCSLFLQTKLDEIDKKMANKSYLIVALFVLGFLIVFTNKNASNNEIFMLIILLSILLITGISTPMIDIDARVQDFSFKLMGEPIEFHNQILFYQSKSIFDVVKILLKTGQFQSILVGILIFLFSIIFPISKLFASYFILLKKSLYKNKFIKFFALKSSKWAMADVIVIAIFMSYIGFSGVIDSQLKQLEMAKQNVEILTTDNSNFGIGFFLFLSFAIGGLFLASKIEKKLLFNIDKNE